MIELIKPIFDEVNNNAKLYNNDFRLFIVDKLRPIFEFPVEPRILQLKKLETVNEESTIIIILDLFFNYDFLLDFQQVKIILEKKHEKIWIEL